MSSGLFSLQFGPCNAARVCRAGYGPIVFHEKFEILPDPSGAVDVTQRKLLQLGSICGITFS